MMVAEHLRESESEGGYSRPTLLSDVVGPRIYSSTKYFTHTHTEEADESFWEALIFLMRNILRDQGYQTY